MLLPKPVKVLHTLHRNVDKKPFVFHIMQHDDTVQTTLLSFTHKKDALMMGNVYEMHHKIHGIYPNNHFTYEKPLDITLDTKDSDPIQYDKDLDELFIEETNEEELFQFCTYYSLDLMVIQDLDNDAKMKILKFETPIDILKQKFEENFK